MNLQANRNSGSGTLDGYTTLSNEYMSFSKLKFVSGDSVRLNGNYITTGTEYDISTMQTIQLRVSGSSTTIVQAVVEIW